MGIVRGDRNGPALCFGRLRCLAVVTDHGDVLQRVHLARWEQSPVQGAGVLAVEDCFEMQVAAGGPSGSTYPGNDLAHLDGFPCPDGDRFQVVVGGDQPVAVVDLHPVAAAPGMPAGGPDNTSVGRVDPRAAGCGVVLAEVEVPRRSGQRADPVAEGRAWPEHLKGRHQGSLRRSFENGGGYVEPRVSVLGDGGDYGPAERHQCPAVREETTCESGKADAAGRRHRLVRLNGRPGKSQGEKGHGNHNTRGHCANRHSAGARRLLVAAGSPMIAHSLTPGLARQTPDLRTGLPSHGTT